MRPENEARLKKIQAISGLLRVVCTVFLALVVLIELLMLSHLFSVHGMPIRMRFVMGINFTLQWAGMFFCVYYLHRLLGNYSRGEIFTRDSAMQIRRWGLVCVLWGALQFVQIYVPGAVLSHPAPSGTSDHLQSYGTAVRDQLVDWQRHGGGRMVNGLIIVAISWFMEMAAEMREEQELIV
jgi:hypothetical protein